MQYESKILMKFSKQHSQLFPPIFSKIKIKNMKMIIHSDQLIRQIVQYKLITQYLQENCMMNSNMMNFQTGQTFGYQKPRQEFQNNVLYLTNFPRELSRKQFQQLFQPFGIINNISVFSGYQISNPYAFVEYDDLRDAVEAKNKLNNSVILGYPIKIEYKKSRVAPRTNNSQIKNSPYRQNAQFSPEHQKMSNQHLNTNNKNKQQRYLQETNKDLFNSNTTSPTRFHSLFSRSYQNAQPKDETNKNKNIADQAQKILASSYSNFNKARYEQPQPQPSTKVWSRIPEMQVIRNQTIKTNEAQKTDMSKPTQMKPQNQYNRSQLNQKNVIPQKKENNKQSNLKSSNINVKNEIPNARQMNQNQQQPPKYSKQKSPIQIILGQPKRHDHRQKSYSPMSSQSNSRQSKQFLSRGNHRRRDQYQHKNKYDRDYRDKRSRSRQRPKQNQREKQRERERERERKRERSRSKPNQRQRSRSRMGQRQRSRQRISQRHKEYQKYQRARNNQKLDANMHHQWHQRESPIQSHKSSNGDHMSSSSQMPNIWQMKYQLSQLRRIVEKVNFRINDLQLKIEKIEYKNKNYKDNQRKKQDKVKLI